MTSWQFELALFVMALVIALLAFFARFWFNRVTKDLEKTKDGLAEARDGRAELRGRVDELMHEHDSIKSDIRGHVEREEKLLWPKVDDLTARLIRIEANLPNGELKTLLYRFAAMEDKLDRSLGSVLTAVADVSAEQKSHNAEAEDWKRRILRLEDHELMRGEADGPK